MTTVNTPIKILKSTTNQQPVLLPFGELACSDLGKGTNVYCGNNSNNPIRIGGNSFFYAIYKNTTITQATSSSQLKFDALYDNTNSFSNNQFVAPITGFWKFTTQITYNLQTNLLTPRSLNPYLIISTNPSQLAFSKMVLVPAAGGYDGSAKNTITLIAFSFVTIGSVIYVSFGHEGISGGSSVVSVPEVPGPGNYFMGELIG